MKIRNLVVLAALAGIATPTWATYCGGGGDNTPPECVVTWDFRYNGTLQNGDPLPTYTGTSSDPTDPNSYELVMQGFTIDRYGSNAGTIYDGANIVSVDGSSSRGIGVTAAGEGTHWGGKIDNYKNDNETIKVRDAVLMDFGDCIVSIDSIKLEAISDTDFKLWAYTGTDTFSINNLDDELPSYDLWAANPDWEMVSYNTGGTSSRTANISNTTAARYFVLIAGASDTSDFDDAFRMKKLVANCNPDDCGGGGPPTGVPVPGTLALLGLGALLLGRKRPLKLA